MDGWGAMAMSTGVVVQRSVHTSDGPRAIIAGRRRRRRRIRLTPMNCARVGHGGKVKTVTPLEFSCASFDIKNILLGSKLNQP